MSVLTIESLRAKTHLTDVQLDKTLEEDHLVWLAPHFGSPLTYIEANGFNLIEARKEDVRRASNTESGMLMALKYWLMQNPFATPRMLLETMLRVGVKRMDLFTNLCQIIKSLKIKCGNSGHGCQWIGELGELETHLQSCDYILLPCHKGCTLPGRQEVTKLLTKDIKYHLKKECPKRNYKCTLCKLKGEYAFLTSAAHLEKCPRKRVHCPNESYGCSTRVQLCNINAHRSTCQFEQVVCKYSMIGCQEKRLRKDINF